MEQLEQCQAMGKKKLHTHTHTHTFYGSKVRILNAMRKWQERYMFMLCDWCPFHFIAWPIANDRRIKYFIGFNATLRSHIVMIVPEQQNRVFVNIIDA